MAGHIEVAREKPRYQTKYPKYKSQKQGHNGTVKIVVISLVSAAVIGGGLAIASALGVFSKPNPKPPVATTSTLNPKKDTPEPSPSLNVSPSSSSSAAPNPTVAEKQTVTPTVEPKPTDNDEDIGIDRWKDNDPVNAGEINIAKFTINKLPFKMFIRNVLMEDSKGNTIDGFGDPYTNDELFYYEVVNGRIKLIPTEYMKQLIEERFPGGKFESQGLDSIAAYLVNEKNMGNDEANGFVNNIRTFKDLRIVNANPDIIPVEERFITPRKDLGLQAEITQKVMELKKYRDEHGMLV